MINVVIVDDSSTARSLLRHIINETDDLKIIGEATNAAEGIRMVQRRNPDVVLMDAIMPEMDGLEATRQIMEVAPTPIVIISSAADDREADLAFKAIRAGALTVLQKPHGPGHLSFPIEARKIQRTLRSMADVRVIHHKPQSSSPIPILPISVPAGQARPEIIGIVSSTGGPGALSHLLEPLLPDYPLPIVVVQHISADFLGSLVKWLDAVSPLPVCLAEQGQLLQAGHVYVAPDSRHMTISRSRTVDLSPMPDSLYRPSGNILLESLANVYGGRAIGVILTGMGDDGVEGLSKMYQRGAMTVAQDEASAVVYGMPKAAVERKVVRQILSPKAIAGYLNSLVMPIQE